MRILQTQAHTIIQTMTESKVYTTEELSRVADQATADYIDCMADMAYQINQSLMEEYDDDQGYVNAYQGA